MSNLTIEIQKALENGDLDLAQTLIAEEKQKRESKSDHIHTMERREKKFGNKEKFRKTKQTEYFDDKSIPSDPKFDIQLKAVRAEPNRPAASKQVKATCRVCGRVEKVNPQFVTKTIGDEEIMSYRCNKCCGGI